MAFPINGSFPERGLESDVFVKEKEGRPAKGNHLVRLAFLLSKIFYSSIIYFLICNQSVSFIVVSFYPKLALKKV